MFQNVIKSLRHFLSQVVHGGMISQDIGIDLGTANTLVYVKGRGILVNEPSVVAMIQTPQGKTKVLAVGNAAKMMLGKTPQNLQAIRPLRDGVIADFHVAEHMIRYFLNKAKTGFSLIGPRVVICVPSGATAVERRAIQESAEGAGARKVFLIEEPMAAAIGAQLPITEPIASMVVDIGGGTTEIAVISLGNIVCARSLRIGGDKMDDAIINYIRKVHNLLIGETTAELIKKTIGSARSDTHSVEEICKVKGRLVTGHPHELSISQHEIVKALAPCVNEIGEEVEYVLSQIPPELASDLVERGMVLTGGGALLPRLSEVLTERTKIPVHVAKDPLFCVVEGTSLALEHLEMLQQGMQGD